MYTTEEIQKLKEWIDTTEKRDQLRKLWRPAILEQRQNFMHTKLTTRCRGCYRVLKAEFGDFSKPLAEQYVACPDGPPEQKHGFWASAINVNLN